MKRTSLRRIAAAALAAAVVTAGAAAMMMQMPQVRRIPAAWPGTYAAYAQAQEARQLPLAAAAGQPGTLYTYALAGSDERAALLVWDGILVGYQVYGHP